MSLTLGVRRAHSEIVARTSKANAAGIQCRRRVGAGAEPLRVAGGGLSGVFLFAEGVFEYEQRVGSRYAWPFAVSLPM